MSVALRYSQFPIGQLLLCVLGDSGLRAGAFMEALGYRKINTGTAAFDRWVNTGAGHHDFIVRLQASPFAAPADQMQAALDDTAAMFRAEEERPKVEAEAYARAAFRPHLRAVPEASRPSWITGFALTGGWRRETVTMPAGFEAWDAERQQVTIVEAVKRHYASSGGRTIFMGAILRYVFVGEYAGTPTYYGVDGVPEQEAPAKSPSFGEAVLRVGNRTFQMTGSVEDRADA